MNLEMKTSVVKKRIRLRPCEKGTKVNVRTSRDGVTLSITKPQIEKHIGINKSPTFRQNNYC